MSTHPASEPAVRRLVRSPVFILSAIRSGSTLLRCVLNAHSEVCAPHELHLADLTVVPDLAAGETLALLGLDVGSLELSLWDAVLFQLLAGSGKQHIVDKTPGNLLLWRVIAEYWPHARFIFLLRRPADILASATRSRPAGHPVDPGPLVTTYLRELRTAISELPGLTVRYEDLTAQPATATARVCKFLGVTWQPAMCNYSHVDESELRFGIGDFGPEIRSGRIQPAPVRSHGQELPWELGLIGEELGYGHVARL